MTKEFMEWLDAEIEEANETHIFFKDRGFYYFCYYWGARKEALEEVKQKLQEHHADDR